MQKVDKKITGLIVVFFLLILTPELLAGEHARKASVQEEQEFHWNDKLGRGFLNIIVSPVEFVRQFHLVASKDTSSAGRLFSFIPAFGNVFLRLGAGVIELLTFPFNFPTAGKTPLIEPL